MGARQKRAPGSRTHACDPFFRHIHILAADAHADFLRSYTDDFERPGTVRQDDLLEDRLVRELPMARSVDMYLVADDEMSHHFLRACMQRCAAM